MGSKRDTIKDEDRFSIVYPCLDRCAVCNCSYGIALHEIFSGVANRVKSKEDGMVAPLCNYHHNGSNEGVHFNKELDTKLKIKGQLAWEKKHMEDNVCTLDEARSAFIRRYGQNYIMED